MLASMLPVYMMTAAVPRFSADQLFITLSAYAILNEVGLWVFPQFTVLSQAHVSLRRLEAFLDKEVERPLCTYLDGPSNGNSTLTEQPANVPSIVMTSASFSWGCNQFSLKSINLTVGADELVAVVGKVGSGKTSLIHAILGEMPLVAGQSVHNGTFAYMPQQPWIINATIRENILLGSKLDSNSYWRAIKACALQDDLHSLPAGDLTIIGERGVTLSGGQKHRLSLARAIYADADIYLFDDPLSAVDTVVASYLLDNVFCETGVLSQKTRVLVTHSVSCLPRMDRVVIMDNGEIVGDGSYSEMEEKLELKAFIQDLQMSLQNPKVSHNGTLRTRNEGREYTDTCDLQVMTEEITSNSINWKLLATYARLFGCKWILAVIIFTAFTIYLEMGRNFQIGLWTEEWKRNNTTALQNNYHNFYLVILFDFSLGFSFVITISLVTAGCVQAARLLHKSTLLHVFHAKVFFYDTTPFGRILNWFTQDLNDVEETIPIKLWMLIVYIVKFGVAMVSSIWISPWILLGFVFALCLIKLIQGLYSCYAVRAMWLYARGRSEVYSSFYEIVHGVVSIHAYRKEKFFLNSFIELLDESMKILWHFSAARIFTMIVTEFIGNALLFVLLLVANLLLDRWNSSIVSAALYAAFSLLYSLNVVAISLTEILRSMVSVDRLRSTEDIPSEEQELPSDHEWKPNVSNRWDQEWNLLLPPTCSVTRRNNGKFKPAEITTGGEIEFTDYIASYRPGLDSILNSISLHVPSGIKVGIVGRTGSGKSSLTYALLNMLEVLSGKIIIDGRDISTMDVSDLRSRITVISQDPVLFDVSLRDNLDPKREHTDAEIWQVLEQTHLKDHITNNEGHLDITEETFQDFSLGQRQLLSLARALLRKSRILILDEATASVDVETDNMMQEILRSSLESCTLLTIAHRINTIIDYDRVLVMDNGCAIEYDDPKILLENTSSIFYQLVKANSEALPS